MIVLIINYNRLTLAKQTADWCFAHDLTPVFVDNHSDYGPLLEYYHDCPYQVYRLNENRGHTVISTLDIKKEFGIDGRYIITDPDLDFTGIPDDFLDVLNQGLDKFPAYFKCGFSLEIRDLPDSAEGNFIRNHAEATYWTRPLGRLYFNAPIDTTFALYRGIYKEHFVHPSMRTNRPYTARHISWYYTDYSSIAEDEKYYFKTANASASGKKRMITQ